MNADLVTNVTAGASISVVCSGLDASQSIALNEASPLAAIVSPASSSLFETSSAAAVVVGANAFGDVSTTFTIPSLFSAVDPAATCPPTQAQVNAGLASCVLTVRDSIANTPIASARLLYAGQPTPQVTPTVNVTNGVSFVAGDVVMFSGSGFWGAATTSTPAVLFGAVIAAPLPSAPITVATTTYVCAVDCNGVAGALTNGGVVTGSVVVPSGLTAGATPVLVMQTNASGFPGNGPFDSVAASSQVSILGAAVAGATPNNGGPGTPVQVTGTGWDPQGVAPTLAFLTPSTPGGPVSSATGFVDANGNLSAVITVTGEDLQGVNPIVVTQGALTTQASYTVTDITSLCVGVSCTTNQVITQQIGAGALTISQQLSNITLSALTLNGASQHSTGQLNAIDVVDDRGILVGWTVTGTLTGDFVNQTPIGISANNLIPASNLSWTPSVSLAAPGSGDLTQVEPGTTASLSKTVGVTLCNALIGGGGGAYRCTATLDLAVPASVAAGTYTVVLNITIT
ncbi:MAG: hypothetical protein QOI95_3591 [Acidimicrobiaceae bacterium]|jgi:hypothetical protein